MDSKVEKRVIVVALICDLNYLHLSFLLQIRERLDQLLAVRGDLHTAWHKKKIYLDQLCDLQCFLRDAKQLDTLSSQQEVCF